MRPDRHKRTNVANTMAARTKTAITICNRDGYQYSKSVLRGNGRSVSARCHAPTSARDKFMPQNSLITAW